MTHAPASPPTPTADLALSYIRTWTPYLVAGALTVAARRYGVVLPESLSAELTLALAVAVGAGSAYYAAARLLERRPGQTWPARAARTIGTWMLAGVVQQPVYVLPPAARAPLPQPTPDGTW